MKIFVDDFNTIHMLTDEDFADVRRENSRSSYWKKQFTVHTEKKLDKVLITLKLTNCTFCDSCKTPKQIRKIEKW